MMPFIDLKAQYARIKDAVEGRIQTVLAHGKFIMGPEVAALEALLAAHSGVGQAVSCASGTDALLLTLLAHGVGRGDLIFTTPFTFIATAEVIALVGATPVFVDIDPATFNMDPDKLGAAISQSRQAPRFAGMTPRGVIPVDLFGQPADYAAINALATAEGLFVVADAAQSFGGSAQGKAVGSLAAATATSFFPAKPLGCFGDGGAVLTDDPDFADTLRSLRVHGKGRDKYDNVRLGLNSRLDTLQAAVLLAKLAVFPDEIEARQQVAARYANLLTGIPGLTLPPVRDGAISAWAQYTLRVADRDRLQAALKAAGIPTGVYYPLPLHLQGAFAGLGYGPGDFPVSEHAAREVLSLPMHPYLSGKDQETIAAALRQAVAA